MQNYFYFSSFLFPSLPLIWPFGLSSFNFTFMQIKQSYPFVCVYIHCPQWFSACCAGRACVFMKRSNVEMDKITLASCKSIDINQVPSGWKSGKSLVFRTFSEQTFFLIRPGFVFFDIKRCWKQESFYPLCSSFSFSLFVIHCLSLSLFISIYRSLFHFLMIDVSLCLILSFEHFPVVCIYAYWMHHKYSEIEKKKHVDQHTRTHIHPPTYMHTLIK